LIRPHPAKMGGVLIYQKTILLEKEFLYKKRICREYVMILSTICPHNVDKLT
jgi:hypothetical protein